MSDLSIRPARADEHTLISALALRSKAHWGYTPEFLEACRSELTFTSAECASGRMWVAERDDELLGCGLLRGEPPVAELAALFVDPVAIGSGCGRRLLNHLLAQAEQLGFVSLVLDADPQAAPFYEHLGARRIGSSPSGSIPGRMLPRLELRSTGPTR